MNDTLTYKVIIFAVTYMYAEIASEGCSLLAGHGGQRTGCWRFAHVWDRGQVPLPRMTQGEREMRGSGEDVVEKTEKANI